MRALLVTLLLVTSSAANGGAMYDGWKAPTPLEIGIHVAAQTPLVLDMLTTLDIKNHKGLREGNQLLGEHPNDAKIYAYFGSVFLINTVIWYLLPPVARQMFVDVPIIVIELPFLENNFSAGLQIRF
jgi:hypothetical protein